MPSRPLRIAHRGMPRRAPENTLPSFEAALAAGADGIELDVHATSDGVVVVHHDPVVRGGAAIEAVPWERLRAMEVAPGVPVPTLAQVCELVAGRVELFVEIKGAAIEAPVLDVLRAYAGPVAIHSFDHAQVERIAATEPGRRLGLLFEALPTDVPAAMSRYGALDVWPHHSLATPRLIDEVHASGGRVIPWTVNSARVAARLASWGVDGLCADDVSKLP